MRTNHNYYLNLAFEIAKTNLGKTKLNPAVGSIVVKNNFVVSSGVTSLNGRPHAEFNALKKNINFRGANLYTTLEPCTHFGLTPPCVNIIIKKKIKKVFYAFNDPDVRTFKKAKNILLKKKIKLKLIKSKYYKNFYDSYYFNKKFNQPFISAKIAISKDYYTINKRSKWITSKHSKKITHYLRSESDCIFSTSKTINKDNSLLNCRIEGLNKFKPDLFIIDLNLKLKKNLSLNKLLSKRSTFLLTKKENKKKVLFFKKKGFKIIFIKSLNSEKDFRNIFKRIYKMGYCRAFFETGLTFLNSLLSFKLLNNLYVLQNDKLLKNNGSNNSTLKFLKKLKLTKKIKINLYNDSLYKKEFKYV
jgi:diaminohydroxyphosphoribosylaminopyrimidine deaminase / 5-amino-6-(5-phosphoribosylamino)uracil reductase